MSEPESPPDFYFQIFNGQIVALMNIQSDLSKKGITHEYRIGFQCTLTDFNEDRPFLNFLLELLNRPLKNWLVMFSTPCKNYSYMKYTIKVTHFPIIKTKE